MSTGNWATAIQSWNKKFNQEILSCSVCISNIVHLRVSCIIINIYICIDRYVEENRTIFDTRRYHEERVKRET